MKKIAICILLILGIFLLASCRECEHTWSAWSVTHEPTSLSGGSQERVCSACGEKQRQAIPMLTTETGEESTTEEAETATEESETATQESETATQETETATETEETSTSCEHNWGTWTATVQPTCNAEGTNERKCTICGKAEAQSITKLAHNMGAWAVTVQPTCNAEGINERKCTVCGKAETQSVAKTAHNMGAWSVTVQPTCNAEGTNERKCTVCGKAEAQSIAKVAHNMGAWAVTVQPTCNAEGTNERKCTVCGKAETQSVAKTAHNMGAWSVTAQPTCKAEGVNERKCTVCGKAETQSIAKVAHSMGEWAVTVLPTCTTEGTKECKCTVCSETQSDTVPMTTHTPKNASECGDVPCLYCGATLQIEHNYTKTYENPASLLSTGQERYRCSKCQATKAEDIPVLDPTTLGMPVIYITETADTALPLLDLEKSDGEISVEYKYVSNGNKGSDFEAYCKIKVQGSSSTQYPKKNYNVKFYEDAAHTDKLKVDLGWGKENKYCMKANYMDASHARNIVGGRIFAQMVASRDNILPGLENAPNYGVVDGFPVLVYLNGSFHGLYTMNIPKDEWMFAMEGDETTKEAALIGDDWKEPVYLRSEIGYDYEASGFELEYCSTADDSWVRDSFNELIRLLNCGNNTRIKQELPAHLDIEAAIDNMLFTYYIIASDNYAKHLYWITYDGKVWAPTVYDLDSTFGIIWDGSPYNSPFRPDLTKWDLGWASNKMYEILIRLYPEEVEARYRELRSSIFTSYNTQRLFNDFMTQIPEQAYHSEWERWPNIPYKENNLTNMVPAIERQIVLLDSIFYDLP